jgi:hypothetical protein
MVWQALAAMWFKMPGGYFVGPGPGGAALLAGVELWTGVSRFPGRG